MDPAPYILIKPNALVLPVSPRGTAIYPQFAAPAQMKMIDNVFARNKNYYLLFMNINRACFCMLNKMVPDQYKVSNTPNLTGWNVSISIWGVLDQLMANYSMPNAMVLFNNNTLFQSPFRMPTKCVRTCTRRHSPIHPPDERTSTDYMQGFNNGGIAPGVVGRQATGRGGRQNPAYSNCYKIFNNWNMCYSHRFDVKDSHNSATCTVW